MVSNVFATTLILSLFGALLYFHLWRSKFRSQGAESLFGRALRYLTNTSFITSIVLALISLCLHFNVVPIILVFVAYFVVAVYMRLWNSRDEVEFINAMSENWEQRSGALLEKWAKEVEDQERRREKDKEQKGE